jgi:acyl-CoA synthetase (AMP-forming)/AMP-acid ligase II
VSGATADKGLRITVNERTTVPDESLRPVAPGSGVIGRLAQRGRVPLGYYKGQAKTAATFPEIDGVRWSLLGDMAMVEEGGTIHVLGRGSQCINTGGEKVFPEEVEATLKGHPAVYDALVAGVSEPKYGQRVSAVVQLRPEVAPPGDEALAAHCRERLAGYKVPRSYVLVDQVVRSPSGKPDYRWAKEVAEREASVAEAAPAG